jgi:hypothetical protein
MIKKIKDGLVLDGRIMEFLSKYKDNKEIDFSMEFASFMVEICPTNHFK